jgi:hypothetical protein
VNSADFKDHNRAEEQWFYLSFWKRMRANITQSPGETIARIIRRGDTVVAKEFSATNSATKGDFRILALSKNVTSSFFSTPPNGQSLRGEGGSLSTQGKDDTQYGWLETDFVTKTKQQETDPSQGEHMSRHAHLMSPRA